MLDKETLKKELKSELNKSLRNYRNNYSRNRLIFLYPLTYFIIKSIYLAILLIFKTNPLQEIKTWEKYGYSIIAISIVLQYIKIPFIISFYLFYFGFEFFKASYEL